MVTWKDLHSEKGNIIDLGKATRVHLDWDEFRSCIVTLPLESMKAALEGWLIAKGNDYYARVLVSNFVGALREFGLITLEGE